MFGQGPSLTTMPDQHNLDELHPGNGASSAATGGLRQVFTQNRNVLLRFLTRRLGDQAAAEDVLQNVWMKFQEKPPSGPIDDPLAFLFSTCENAARDLRRSDMRRHAREGRWVEDQDQGQAATHLTPEKQALDRERLDAAERCLAGLPERTRQIFIGFRLEGQSQKELMDVHGISLSAIQKHLQRAYHALTNLHASEETSDDDAQKDGP